MQSKPKQGWIQEKDPKRFLLVSGTSICFASVPRKILGIIIGRKTKRCVDSIQSPTSIVFKKIEVGLPFQHQYIYTTSVQRFLIRGFTR
jgi:hypothetical protein